MNLIFAATSTSSLMSLSVVSVNCLYYTFCFQVNTLSSAGSCTDKLYLFIWHICVLCVVIVANVNRAKDFAEIRKHEQEMERQVMQNVRRMAHDTMTEKQEVCESIVVFTCHILYHCNVSCCLV